MATYVIAEVGVNHNGSLDNALRMVEVAKECGADAVKFQTFKSENLVTAWGRKADYQARTTDGAESQLDMLRRLEVRRGDFPVIRDHCRSLGIDFLVTPFDVPGVHFLTGELGLGTLKLASGEVTNAHILLAAARTGARVILSTGMSSLAEVEFALGVLAYGYTESHQGAPPGVDAFAHAYGTPAGRAALAERVTLLQCTSDYPAPPADANLLAMDTMRERFGLPVGLSDHTPGIIVAVAAVARGAGMVEKHFTLSRRLPGPDHPASLEPGELADLIRAVRTVEAALGDGIKQARPSELPTRDIARRSLVAAGPIRCGERFNEDNLIPKRPADGVPSSLYWDYIGRQATRDYAADELIDP